MCGSLASVLKDGAEVAAFGAAETLGPLFLKSLRTANNAILARRINNPRLALLWSIIHRVFRVIAIQLGDERVSDTTFIIWLGLLLLVQQIQC